MRRTACILTAILLWSSTGWSFCRTQTCDESVDDCGVSARGCPTGGIDVFWPTQCISYAIQEDGSRLDDISAELTEDLMTQAVSTWMAADCDGSVLQLTTGAQGEVECNQPEFNCGNGDTNYNAIMFRENGWPYDPDALAITTVSVDMRTGEVLDADMELNSTDFAFSLPDETPTADLLSVLTHEVGHMLGLAHSDDADATMFAFYNPRSLGIRELSNDDAEGICDVFGGGDDAPECNFSPSSGDTACLGGTACEAPERSSSCSVSSSTTNTTGGLVMLGLAGMGGLLRRSRRRR